VLQFLFAFPLFMCVHMSVDIILALLDNTQPVLLKFWTWVCLKSLTLTLYMNLL